jgi:RNA polymerase sigma factor (sigma-70 family)
MADQVVGAEQAGSLDERAVIARAAWRERSTRLYRELEAPAARMVRRAFGRAFDEAEIEDVYANAWVGTLRTLGHRHTKLSDQEIRRYVMTAVAHHASKELRRRGRKPTAPLEALGEVADPASAPDERAVAMEDADLARDLLTSLPKRRRAVMLLRYGWGLEPAQVCRLVKGLSRRAYRKEITRGIDELTEKLKLVERGDWCADREPLLKAFVAGTASEEERRQARHHLSRCHDCSHLVARLTGHLHSLGGAAAMPGALDALGHAGLHDRVAALAERARAALPGPLGGDDSADVATVISAGGARGGGAAGLGIAAKLAGAGLPAKVVAACLAGGAAATTCIATGVLPSVGVPGLADRPPKHGAADAQKRPAKPHDGGVRAGTLGPGFVRAASTVAPVENSPPTTRRTPLKSATPATATTSTPPTTTTTTTTTTPTTPLAPSTPPAQQQFGVASATPGSDATTPSSGTSSSGSADATSGGSPADQEFGP